VRGPSDRRSASLASSRSAAPHPTLSPRADPCPHVAGLPLRMAAFACVPAPLALKAVTSHRTPHSSPFWSRPLVTVRQPGTGRIMECGETSPLWLPRGAGRMPKAPFSTAPLHRMWAKVSPEGEGRDGASCTLVIRKVLSPAGLARAEPRASKARGMGSPLAAFFSSACGLGRGPRSRGGAGTGTCPYKIFRSSGPRNGVWAVRNLMIGNTSAV